MDIEFDRAKDALNIAKYGLSLADAAAFELASARVTIDDRFDYGESRYRAFLRAREKEMRRYE
jgi:uncharacterized DUF497 family protein